jgi:PEP-CTERM motif
MVQDTLNEMDFFVQKLFACVLFTGAVAEVQAASVFYDSFNYSPAGAQVSAAGSPNWSLRTAGQVDPKMATGSVSYPGLQSATGDNSVVFDGVAPAAGIASRLLDQVYNIGNAPTLYYSLTFRVTSITTADWGGSGNFLTGSYMMGFSQDTTGALANGSAAAPLLIRTGDPNNTSGIANDFQSFQLGTGVTAVSPGSRVFDGSHNYNPGDTLFLVLSYTFGPGASDDVARLYVNPVPGTLEAANSPVVTTTPGVADVTNSQIQAFFLRNNSVEPASTLVDNLRVGTSWADVTPVPEPSALAVIALSAAGFFVRRRRQIVDS